MEIEDGVIWVYGVGEDVILAFTEFGIENPTELIKLPKVRFYARQALGSVQLISAVYAECVLLNWRAMKSPARNATATIVSAVFTAPAEGKVDASTTNSPLMP
jgi:hypothetical protein